MIVYVLFVHKKSVSKRKVCIIFIKNSKKNKNNNFLVGFLGGFWGFFVWGFLGGFFIANPDSRPLTSTTCRRWSDSVSGRSVRVWLLGTVWIIWSWRTCTMPRCSSLSSHDLSWKMPRYVAWIIRNKVVCWIDWLIDWCVAGGLRAWRSSIGPRDGIFKLLSSPEIDTKESFPPAYVAWRTRTTTYSYPVPSRPHRLF